MSVGQTVNTFNNLTNNGSLTGNLDVAIINVISALGTGPFYSRFALAQPTLQIYQLWLYGLTRLVLAILRLEQTASY
jgi:hypothetical protein